MTARKSIVSISFSKPGIQPPVYLAGSFSNPAWLPQPMPFTVGQGNEHQFHATVEVEEGGEYQYKFRIGEGDWWVLNEDSPTGRFRLYCAFIYIRDSLICLKPCSGKCTC
jgi:hypothetical protein